MSRLACSDRILRDHGSTGNNFGTDGVNSLEPTLQLIQNTKLMSCLEVCNNAADEELQQMICHAIDCKSIEAVRFICQQGAHPFQATGSLKKVGIGRLTDVTLS